MKLKAKLHHAHITACNPDYIGSITICPRLMDICGFVDGEQVHIWGVDPTEPNTKQPYMVTSQDNLPPRIVTYAFAGQPGEMSINGGGARYFHVGQKIIIAAFDMTDEPLEPVMLRLNEKNEIIESLSFGDRK